MVHMSFMPGTIKRKIIKDMRINCDSFFCGCGPSLGHRFPSFPSFHLFPLAKHTMWSTLWRFKRKICRTSACHIHTHTDTVDLVTVIRQTPRWLPLYLCATAYACECVCVSQNLLPLYLYIIIMPGWQTKC